MTVTQKPDIITCDLGAESIHGEAANSTSKDGSTDCSSIQHAYINFVPVQMHFNFDSSFDFVPPDSHSYISTFAYGIFEADVTIVKYSTSGKNMDLFLNLNT